MAPKRGRAEDGSAATAEPEEDDFPAELTCPICHHLLHDPRRTPCGHAFCSFCLDRLFAVRRPTDTHVQAEQRERDCPMCRAPLRLADASPDSGLDRQAARSFPAMHRQRGREIEQERARLAARRLEHPTLYIGNLHSLRAPQGGSSNVHDWTFFVRMEDAEEEARYIERVAIHLHPTFRPSTLNLMQPPFAVRRLGWGYFVIRAEVTFKPEWGHETLSLQWMLDFEDQGSMRQVDLELEHRPVAGEPAGPPLGGNGGASADAGASSDDFDGEGSEAESEEDSDEEDEAGAAGTRSDHEFGDAGGDYDLSRFLRAGWRDSPPTSSSEGDPPAVDYDAPDSGSDGE